jgi:hypothetical protein
MATTIDDLLPKALECRKKIAEVQGEKASEYARAEAAKDAEKQALIEQFSKPSGVSDEERMKRAAAIVRRALNNGLAEVEVGRFPNKLFTDSGRAINQQEPGWEKALVGLPKELFQFWQQHLQPPGYKILFEMADWPGRHARRRGDQIELGIEALN